MIEPKLVENLFRFINVRPVQDLETLEDRPFLLYQHGRSPFAEELAQHRRTFDEIDPTAPTRVLAANKTRAAMQKLAQDFLASSAYLKVATQEPLASFLTLGDRLRAAANGDIAATENLLNAAAGMLDDENVTALTDSYLAALIGSGVAETHQALLLEALSVYWLLFNYHTALQGGPPLTHDLAAQFLAVEPRLPPEIFPIPSAGQTIKVRNNFGDFSPSRRIEELTQEVGELGQAADTVEHAYREALANYEAANATGLHSADAIAVITAAERSTEGGETTGAGLAPPPQSLDFTLKDAAIPQSVLDTLASLGLPLHAINPKEALTIIEETREAKINRIADIRLASSIGAWRDPVEASDIELLQPSGLPGAGLFRPLGFGDLNLVRQELLRYRAAEIAHIENVLHRESKSREHLRMQRTETETVQETERVREIERDLESTERFEVEEEASIAQSRERSLSGAISISAQYGPVRLAANAEYSSKNARNEANSSASSYSREIVQRSLESLREKTRTVRTQRRVEMFQEKNEHKLDNVDGKGHVIGIYRWLSKVYRAQVFNYGRRFMYDIAIPEPGAFLRLMREAAEDVETPVEPPPKPVVLVNGAEIPLAPRHLAKDNVAAWAGLYRLDNLTPPPPLYKLVTRVVEYPYNREGDVASTAVTKIDLPEGYVAEGAYFVSRTHGPINNEGPPKIVIGRHHVESQWHTTYQKLDGESGVLEAGITNRLTWAHVITIEIECKRTDELMSEWRMKTYAAIMNAYDQMKDRYDQLVANARAQQQGSRALAERLAGGNPTANLERMADELKRQAIALLTGRDYSAFSAVQRGGSHGYPEIDADKAREEGRFIRFFEQCFEWRHMAWFLYPYFWGKKGKWREVLGQTEPDEAMDKFMKAGAARVVVPVRPGFEKAMLHYQQTGQLWHGGKLPVINDPLYLAIDQEIKEQTADHQWEGPVGDPWEYETPTTLVMLQETSDLPDWSASATLGSTPELLRVVFQPVTPHNEIGDVQSVALDLQATNPSGRNVAAVSLEATYQSGLTFTKATPGQDYHGGKTLRFDLGDIKSGDGRLITLEFQSLLVAKTTRVRFSVTAVGAKEPQGDIPTGAAVFIYEIPPHLSKVPTMAPSALVALNNAGIYTVSALAQADAAMIAGLLNLTPGGAQGLIDFAKKALEP